MSAPAPQTRRVPAISSTVEVPRRALEQATAWCAARAILADPRGSLRGGPFGARPISRLEASLVHDAIAWRSLAVREWAAAADPDGRLLAYYPDSNLRDGAAQAASDGFLDLDNCPPWESWVALLVDEREDISRRRMLVSWVPAVFVPHASAGIEVNPEECIRWLSERSPP